MIERKINTFDAALLDILQHRGRDITWLMVHGDTDQDADLWVRVRAVQAARQIQFVVVIPSKQKTDIPLIAARVLTEALQILKR